MFAPDYREKKKVVVAVRGTSSIADLVTDAVVHPEPMEDWIPAVSPATLTHVTRSYQHQSKLLGQSWSCMYETYACLVTSPLPACSYPYCRALPLST